MGFRVARAEDAAELTELALRSKAHWGYGEEFMAVWRADLTITAEDCASGRIGVTEEDGRVVGFYQIGGKAPEGALMDLFVEPKAMGQGVGRRLLERAKRQARELGFASLSIHSDPHAEGFYIKMGARRVGSVASEVVPGRELPLLMLEV